MVISVGGNVREFVQLGYAAVNGNAHTVCFAFIARPE